VPAGLFGGKRGRVRYGPVLLASSERLRRAIRSAGGLRAQGGAERLYGLLRERLARTHAETASQGGETLLPSDLRAPWRGSPARKDAGPCRA